MTRLLATMAAILAVVSARAEPVRYTGWLVMMPTTMRDGGTEQIPTTILKPPGDGPFAAVVVLHDCSGLSPRSSGAPMRWATLLAGQGYVAIVPDSFSTRGFPEGVCTAPEEVVPQLRRVAPIQRAYDAYAALAYLRSFPFVDGEHVGVIGGSHGGSSTLAAMVTPASNRAPLVEERHTASRPASRFIPAATISTAPGPPPASSAIMAPSPLIMASTSQSRRC